MPQIGPLEILVVGTLALIVLGPEKLPGLARSAGAHLKRARATIDEFKAEFESDLDAPDEDPSDEHVSDGSGERAVRP